MNNTEKMLRNSAFSVGAQVLTLLLSFINRRIFIHFLDIEYLGYQSLFGDVFSLLSVAELGIGNIIAFHADVSAPALFPVFAFLRRRSGLLVPLPGDASLHTRLPGARRCLAAAAASGERTGPFAQPAVLSDDSFSAELTAAWSEKAAENILSKPLYFC